MPSSKILSCGMLFIMCLISVSLAQDELQLQGMQLPNEQEELLKDIQELLHNIQSMLDQANKTGAAENANFGCRCSGLNCRCCQRIRLRRLRFDRYCCLNVRYLRRNVGFLITLTLGRRTLFRREISVRNPIPICVGAPFLRRAAKVCIQLNGVSLTSRSVYACATFSVRLFYVTVARFRLGCYTIRFRRDEEMEPASALELTPFYDEWIGTQPDPAVPDFEEDGVPMMTENIGGHPPLMEGRGDVVMEASMEQQTSMENDDNDAVMMANIEKPDLVGDLL